VNAGTHYSSSALVRSGFGAHHPGNLAIRPMENNMAKPNRFSAAAKSVSRFTGGALCFGLALALVLGWALTGPLFGFSETWQMVINTGTTIITFLMVFLIQNSQNRDTEAIQIKLDELIRATKGAQNALLDLEDLDPEELEKFRSSYTRMARQAKDPDDQSVTAAGVPAIELGKILQDEAPERDAATGRGNKD
jgi:low affinity Fe/Cu permease